MKKDVCLVTGAAGFIGSTLAEKLIDLNYEVVGIDSFFNNYSREIKEKNISQLKNKNKFVFFEGDILNSRYPFSFDEIDYVFHIAGIPGVRDSWGEKFKDYFNNNILATQNLLEKLSESNVKKLIYSSSSSIYGETEILPTPETVLPKPLSPYAASKLAAENLMFLYGKKFKIPVVSLRLFTVYGPRQRPDLFFNKCISRILRNEHVDIFGDGKQKRSYTYIDDVVNGFVGAMKESVQDDIFNIGGGESVSVNEIIDIIEKILEEKAQRKFLPIMAGEPKETFADFSKAKKEFGYNPKTKIKEGLINEINWIKENKCHLFY